MTGKNDQKLEQFPLFTVYDRGRRGAARVTFDGVCNVFLCQPQWRNNAAKCERWSCA